MLLGACGQFLSLSKALKKFVVSGWVGGWVGGGWCLNPILVFSLSLSQAEQNEMLIKIIAIFIAEMEFCWK